MISREQAERMIGEDVLEEYDNQLKEYIKRTMAYGYEDWDGFVSLPFMNYKMYKKVKADNVSNPLVVVHPGYVKRSPTIRSIFEARCSKHVNYEKDNFEPLVWGIKHAKDIGISVITYVEKNSIHNTLEIIGFSK